VYYGEDEFNGFQGYAGAHLGRRYVIAMPLLSMALTGLAYGCRWFEQYTLLTKTNAYYRIAYLKENMEIHVFYIIIV
jgi:hypothetical protein